MTQISPSFTLEEFYHSDTALRLGINNTPGENDVENIKKLVHEVLQPLRDYFSLPVVIRSGYRSVPLNHAVGGEVKSQHLRGQAADITINGIGNDVIWQYIVDNIPFDQVILEHAPAHNTQLGWIHVSYSDVLRKDAISCTKTGVYLEGLHYAVA